MPVVSVVLRRLVKTLLFAQRDERRLRWAHIVEQALAGSAVPPVAPRFSWDCSAAEEVLLERLGTALPPGPAVLQSLFRSWGLFECRRRSLRHGNPWDQARSALVLARMQCADVLFDVAGFLQRAPSDLQVAGVNALELLAKPAAIPALLEFLACQGTCRVRPVLSALIACSQDTPQSLLPSLRHRLPAVRSVVAGALAEVATARKVPALIRAAGDPEPEVRAKVARALGRGGEAPEAGDALLRLAADPVWYVRLQAVGALARTRSTEIHDRLLEATRDKNWRVRGKATTALYQVGGDPAGLFRCLSDGEADAYALGALVTTLEREGATWNAVRSLVSTDGVQRENGRALVAGLLRAHKLTTILHALEVHPDAALHQELRRLFQQTAGPGLRTLLEKWLRSSTTEAARRKSIKALLAASPEVVMEP